MHIDLNPIDFTVFTSDYSLHYYRLYFKFFLNESLHDIALQITIHA